MIIQVVICIVIYTIIPNLFQNLDMVRYNEKFLVETRARHTTISTSALREDVENGLAKEVGDKIDKAHIIQPTGVYFEQVARIDPSDPDSPNVGIGRFNAEIWVCSWFGIDFTRFTKPQLVATRFFFDALFPFVLLFIISAISRPEPRKDLDRFFAKMIPSETRR